MKSICEVGWGELQLWRHISAAAWAASIFIAQNISIIPARGHCKGREATPVPGNKGDVFIYCGVQSVVSSIYLT